MTQINPQIFDHLASSLRDANRQYTAGGRGGVRATLQALITYCEAYPELQPGLTPLVACLASLDDLDRNAVSPIVKPAVYRNRPPDLAYRKVVKAVALACADTLRRAGMPRKRADGRVAAHLQKLGIDLRGRGDSSGAKSLAGWRQSGSRPKESLDQFADTFEAFVTLLSERKYATAEEAWLDLKVELENLVTGLRPALR